MPSLALKVFWDDGAAMRVEHVEVDPSTLVSELIRLLGERGLPSRGREADYGLEHEGRLLEPSRPVGEQLGDHARRGELALSLVDLDAFFRGRLATRGGVAPP